MYIAIDDRKIVSGPTLLSGYTFTRAFLYAVFVLGPIPCFTISHSHTLEVAMKTPFVCLAFKFCLQRAIPESKVHGGNMGPIWGRQDPGGPHVGTMNYAIWDRIAFRVLYFIVFSFNHK